MKSNLICSAGSKQELESMINRYFYSKNYIITEDLKVFNKTKQKSLESYTVKVTKKRWRFELLP